MKDKTKPSPEPKPLTPDTTQVAKATLDELGAYWAQGYDLLGDELVSVVTHLDQQTRTVFIEYITRPPVATSPAQKVAVRRRPQGH